MFRILLADGGTLGFFWPIELTTVTDGGALLLFVKNPRQAGAPIKRLARAYSAQAWWSVEEVQEWYLNDEPWEATYDPHRV